MTSRRFGSISAIIMGIAYLSAGLAFLVLPKGFTSGVPAEFIQAYADTPGFLNAQYLAWTVVGLAGLGAVPAISELVRPVNDGWLKFSTKLGLLAFAILAVDNVRSMALDTILARIWMAGDATVRTIITTTIVPYQHLEPHDYITSGGTGVWILAVSLLGLRSGKLSKWMGYLGVVAASLYMLVVYGKVMDDLLIFSIVAMSAIVIGPLWYIGMGLSLWRQAEDQKVVAHPDTAVTG